MTDAPAPASTRTSRVIKASREALYRAFTDPAALVVWLPPGEMTGEFYSFDARVGGGYRMSLFYPPSEQVFLGKTSEKEDNVTARFVELQPPARIVQAMTFNSPDPAFSGEMTMVVTFEVADGGTEVTVVCEQIPPGIRPEDNDAGCRSSLEKLARYIATTSPRVALVPPPYPPELQAVFDRIMPPGVPPLALFTTLARVPRIWDRFRAGSLLDHGPISIRQREIVIDRTCARCGCAYEWGVHVAFFAERATLTPEHIRATIHGDAEDPIWSDEDRLLIRLVDELHDSANISDQLWEALAATFSIEQIFELIALVGFYHTVSFFANGLGIAAEPYGVSPPA